MPTADAPLRSVLPGLWTAAWLHRRRTLLALALLVLAKLAAVAVPMVLKAIVDRFSSPSRLGAPLFGSGSGAGLAGGDVALVLPVFLLLSYALLRLASTVFTELRDTVFSHVTLHTVSDYAERSFAHLMSLSPRFHLQRNTGSLVRSVDRGTEGVGFLLGAGLFTMVPTLVEAGAVLAVLAASYSLWFTLAIVVTFVVYGSFTMTLTQRRVVRQRRVNEIDARAHGHLVDGLINYETIKTHAREDFERHRYAQVLRQWVGSSMGNQRALSLLHVGQGAIIAVGVAAVMLLAGEQTLRGAMTVGDLVLVNAYVIQICLPLNALGFVFREARDALVNTEALFRLLRQTDEVTDPAGRPALVVHGGTVRFEHVDFSYEPGRQILFGVDIEIPAGTTLAVVGGSGSGKSTLARLLLRLYDADAGRITLDGQDLRGVRLASLRDAIGVVPQDTVLFNDTIGYNIGYGRLGSSMADVIEAARAAQVHEFIVSLPDGYETLVGERGLKLSGGEKQRIAIARAFLKNPPVLIFDEATSALDTRAERAIQNELDRIAQGRTTLVIAHRLSTVVNADLIIVMDRGHIVERGRHEALLAQGGLYAQLWHLQQQQRQFDRLERQLARQPVDLAQLLSRAVDGLHEAFEERRVRLFTRIDIDDASVTADPSTLAGALRELFLWTLEATPVDGRIELALQRQGPDARLSVTDGRAAQASAQRLPGGDPAAASGAAPMGVPAPRRGSVPSEGMSDPALDPLALRSTIERQGGRLLIEAPTAMRGLRYVIELPLRAVRAPSQPALTAPPASMTDVAPVVSLAGLRVMCIDDRDDARQALVDVLTLEGAQVSPWASGSAAIDWLMRHGQAEWPELMVCDIALGDEDGHTVVQRLRQLEIEREVPLNQRMPVLALSGLAGEDDRLRALMAGFQMHLAKPVNPRALVRTVAALAGRDQATPPGRHTGA